MVNAFFLRYYSRYYLKKNCSLGGRDIRFCVLSFFAVWLVQGSATEPLVSKSFKLLLLSFFSFQNKFHSKVPPVIGHLNGN